MRAFLYARVSTDDPGHNGSLSEPKQTPEPQLDEMRAFCQHRGWEIAGCFVDRISAARKRPEFEEMLRLIRAGKCDVVLCRHYDRIARSTRQLVTLLEELRILNVDFISLNQQLDTTTPTGRLMFVMIAGFAEFERDMIRERVRLGLGSAKALLDQGLPTRRGKTRWAGRPRLLNVDLSLINARREQGASFREIAKEVGISYSTVMRLVRTAVTKTRENDASKMGHLDSFSTEK